MNTNFQFKAYHKPSGITYYFDLMQGNKQNVGNGYIAMLPVGEEIKKSLNYPDNRIAVDPNECEISQLQSKSVEVSDEEIETESLKNFPVKMINRGGVTFDDYEPLRMAYDAGMKSMRSKLTYDKESQAVDFAEWILENVNPKLNRWGLKKRLSSSPEFYTTQQLLTAYKEHIKTIEP